MTDAAAPLVSAIVVSFKGADIVAECLDSLFAQSYAALLKYFNANDAAMGDWTAKRTMGAKIAPSAPAVVASQTNDVTGVWNFAVETPQGSGTPTFTFKQEGEKLTGQYKGAFGEAPVTGTVKGNKIDFSFKASGPVEGTVTYTGTIDGNTMKGTAKFGDLGEATWTAKKQ